MSTVLVTVLCVMIVMFNSIHSVIYKRAASDRVVGTIVKASLTVWLFCILVKLLHLVGWLSYPLSENLLVIASLGLVSLFWLTLRQVRFAIIQWKLRKNDDSESETD